MHLRIQRMAVGSPVGAKDEHDISVASLRVGDGRGNVVTRIRLFIVNGRGGLLRGTAYDQ
jgi:hypothetical protein